MENGPRLVAGCGSLRIKIRLKSKDELKEITSKCLIIFTYKIFAYEI